MHLLEKIYTTSKQNNVQASYYTTKTMSTLFYDGDIDKAMNSGAQNYPDLEDENLDGENDAVELEKDDPSKIYSDDDFEENVPTKEIKKLYKKACKGYGEYQQYLVDTYIQKYYPDLLDIEDKEIRDYKIAKIGEEIVFTADNYIRMVSTSDDEDYIIDYDTYKIRMPRSSYTNNYNYNYIITGNNCALSEETWNKLQNPVRNEWCVLTSCHGVYNYKGVDYWGCRPHSQGSVDISAEYNTPIYPIAEGQVIVVNIEGDFSSGDSTGACFGGGCSGNYIIIQSNINGEIIQHSYYHLSKVNVQSGEYVSSDTIIGLMGTSGNSTGTHLDYNFRIISKDGKVNMCNPEILVAQAGCSFNFDCEDVRKSCGL